MNRTELIKKAASLPKGDLKRRTILAGLSKAGKVEIGIRNDHFQVNIRVQVGPWKIGDLIKEASEILGNVSSGFFDAKLVLEAQGVKGIGWKTPKINDVGISCGRAGLIFDHFFTYTFDKDSMEMAYPNRQDAVKILTRHLKRNGIKV